MKIRIIKISTIPTLSECFILHFLLQGTDKRDDLIAFFGCGKKRELRELKLFTFDHDMAENVE
jgi:hypothetical protein